MPVFFYRIIHIDPDLPNGTAADTLVARDEEEGQQLTFFFTEYNNEDAFALDPDYWVYEAFVPELYPNPAMHHVNGKADDHEQLIR